MYYVIGSFSYDPAPNDMDFLCTSDQKLPVRLKSNGLKKEHHINDEIYYILDKYVCEQTKQTRYLNKQELLTLKLSHLNYDINWGKHYTNCLMWLNEGITPIEPMYKELRKAWISVHGNKNHINLNKPAEQFFTVNKSHDELHQHFAFGWFPRFKEFLKDGSDVLPDKNKFFAMPLQHQYQAVMEEAMVIAYERNKPLAIGLKKLYTDLTKGWFNDFITLNLLEVNQHLKTTVPIYKQKVEELK